MAVSVSCSSHQQTMGGGGVGEGSNSSLFLSLLDGVRRSSQIWRLVRASPYSNSSPPSLASNYKDEEEGSKEALPPIISRGCILGELTALSCKSHCL